MDGAAESALHEAVRGNDVAGVRAALAAGADPGAADGRGWTPLHLAARATESDPVAATAVLTVLLEAAHEAARGPGREESPGEPVGVGPLLEHPGPDGRTALHLAAEFSPVVEPVRSLLDHGARPDIVDGHGNHVAAHAREAEVAHLLAVAAGVETPALPDGASAAPRALTLRDWRAAKRDVRGVFEQLDVAGFVALAGAGSTQSDGFDECAEALVARGGRIADLVGFCYYTRQDAHRARGTGWLPLAFWGAPDGSPGPMVHAGETVVRAFRGAGFRVEWDGTQGSRPCLDLTCPRDGG